MSADNGIYILQTKGPEWRVAYASAVENVYWDDEKKEETDDTKVHIKNARIMWGDSEVYTDEEAAVRRAWEIYREEISGYGIIEYGVSKICIDEIF